MAAYLGWDVGIKNLAYCLLKDNGTSLKILDWGIIDLQNVNQVETQQNKDVLYLSSRPKVKCKQPNSKNKTCGKTATFVFKQNVTQGVCGIHAKKICSDTLYSTRGLPKCSFVTVKKSKGQQIRKKCSKKSTYVFRDNPYVGYCTIHNKKILRDGISGIGADEEERSKLNNKMIKIIKKKRADRMPILTLSNIMYKELDKIPKLLQATKVIIENQPVLKNPTMKTVQIFLYSYFVLRGIVDKKKTKSSIDDIICFLANNKLKAFTGDETQLDQDILSKIKKGKNKYQRTKKLGILYCQEMIKKSDEPDGRWQQFFESSKKKDDLADAYLTTCYYIQSKIKG